MYQFLDQKQIRTTNEIEQWCLAQYVGRDSDHGVSHVMRVKKTALELYSSYCLSQTEIVESLFAAVTVGSDKITEDICIVALAHDIADNKFTGAQEKRARLLQYLQESLGVKRGQLLVDIIDRISWSRESRSDEAVNLKEWQSALGRYGVMVRNIVSDADKLDALGVVGVLRCIEYSARESDSIPEIYESVLEHADRKLTRLPEYIRTVKGQMQASGLVAEMTELLMDESRMIRHIETIKAHKK